MSHEQFTLTRQCILGLGGIITFFPTICSMNCGMDCIEVVRFPKIPKWKLGAITLTCTQAIVTNVWFCVSNILEQNK
jgi:hypothetical protein